MFWENLAMLQFGLIIGVCVGFGIARLTAHAAPIGGAK